mmetsp:Transcript_24456/g.56314  ORF Transcript_24456/g.56314 Transcript_24456/m.56314 type:complete len:217 (+) Transcript_24456:276-926(+)
MILSFSAPPISKSLSINISTTVEGSSFKRSSSSGLTSGGTSESLLRLLKKCLKRESRGCSVSFAFCFAFLAPPPLTFFCDFSTVTSLPSFQSMVVALISWASISPRQGQLSFVWYSLLRISLVKYGLATKWKSILKPRLVSSSLRWVHVIFFKYFSTGLSHSSILSSKAGWCWSAINQKSSRAGDPESAEPATSVSSTFANRSARASKSGFWRAAN